MLNRRTFAKVLGATAPGGLHVVRDAKTSSLHIRTAAGRLSAAPLTARK